MVLLALAGAVASGCEAQTSGPRSRAGSGSAREAAPEPGYVVDVEVPPKATRGQESIAHVRVRPTGPWHMNLEYPAKLQLRAPDDVELEASVLRQEDAHRYDDQALEFSVLFTPQAHGARTIEARLDFAVCGDASCGPVSESVELAFDVGCRAEDTGLC